MSRQAKPQSEDLSSLACDCGCGKIKNMEDPYKNFGSNNTGGPAPGIFGSQPIFSSSDQPATGGTQPLTSAGLQDGATGAQPMLTPTPVPFRNYESYMAPYQSVQIRYRDALRGQQKPTDLPIKTTTTYIPGMYEEELFQSEKPDHNSATFINYSLPLSGKANIKNLVQNGLDNYNAPFFASPKETPLYKCKIPLTKSCLIKFNSKEDAQKIVDMFKEE